MADLAVGEAAAGRGGSRRSGPRAKDGSALSRRALPSSTLVVTALAVLMIATGLLLVYLTRGTSFWFDEWSWIVYRRGDNVSTFLSSYDGHFSLVPIAIYRLLFATVGLGTYVPYRVMVIVSHLICGALVFIYARRRVPDLLALCAAALILLFGAGWQDFLWPFQVAWLISVGSGLGALLMLDRRDGRGDLTACVLLAVSLASSGVGIVIAVGLVVEMLWDRRRWREAWIVAAPLILYAAWWVVYQKAGRTASLSEIPRFVVNTAAAAVGGLAGRPGDASVDGGQLLTWGRPLAAAAVLLLVGRLVVLRRIPRRVLTLLAMLAAFWLATAYTRAWLLHGDQAWASRYIYVSGLLVVLLAVELFARVRFPWSLQLGLAFVAAAAVVFNVKDNLRPGAEIVRASGQQTRADLGALQIGRRLIGPHYFSVYLPGTPLVLLFAHQYFAVARTLGTPADSPRQIMGEPDNARETADLELIRIHRIALQPPPPDASLGPRPHVDDFAGGTLSSGKACVTYRGSVPASPAHSFDLTVPAAGLLLEARRGATNLGVRRFAPGFVGVAGLHVPASGQLRIRPDGAPEPWHVDLATSGEMVACGLRG